MRPACWSRPAVRLGYQMVGNDPAPALCLARQAADALGLPLMVHVIDMDARERGVVFDVGHGVGSFDCQVAPAAVGHDFAPDTVSSDLHAHNVGGPVYDQATTLSKPLHVGMTLDEVIRASTSTPARAIGRQGGIGSMAVGTSADLSILELRTRHWDLPDAAGPQPT